MSKRSPRSEAAILLLFSPLLISWGAGTTGRFLDLAAAPAALVGSIPARTSFFGLIVVVVIAVAAASKPSPAASRVARTLFQVLAVALLAPAAAASRPLPWLAAAFLAAAWLRNDAPDEPSSPEPRLWELLALPALWVLCARVRPWGPGLLPDGWLDLGAATLGSRPVLADALAVLIPLAAIPLLAGPTMRGARSIALGAGGAVVLVATFGSDQAWLSAAVLGGVIGAWPPRRATAAAQPNQLLYLLLICACASGRLALTERWRCGDVAEEAPVKELLAGDGVIGLALSAGNLGYLALLAEEGRVLQRMTVTGALGDRAALEPAGGFLVSPVHPGDPVVRVVPNQAGAMIEWWDVPRLERTAFRELSIGCSIDRAMDEGGGRLLLGCKERTFRFAGDEPITELDLDGFIPHEALNRGLLVHREGVLSRAEVLGAEGTVASSSLGPYASDVASAPGRFLVARGPAGHLDLRAAPTAIPSLYEPPSDPKTRVIHALKNRSDRVRVGVWPGEVHYSPRRRAAYVTSPVDASVTLVDVDVTWHQRAVSVGAPPRQVVLETGSATLYVANRCGVFAVRIPRPDPWE